MKSHLDVFPQAKEGNKTKNIQMGLHLCFCIAKETINKEILLRVMSESLLPLFSSRRFVVLGLLYKSLIHFAFMACVFDAEPKKSLRKPTSRSFLPLFSSRSFMVSDLMFKFFFFF